MTTAYGPVVMWRRWMLIIGAALLSLPSTVAGFSQQLPATVLEEKGLPIRWHDLTIAIPPGAFDHTTTLSLKRTTATNRQTAASQAPLPARQTTLSDVYDYRFNHRPQTALTVRLAFEFDASNSYRKQIWYLPAEGDQWQRLRTTMHKSDGYVEARLITGSGRLLVTADRAHREAPIKHTWFTAYPGTRLSDTAAVLDVKSGKWLYRQQATKQRHIASITKLMTVALFLQSEPDLEEIIAYQSNADRIGAAVVLKGGDRLSLRDALMSTLMPSANNMAVTLAQHSGLGWTGFITAMNAQAAEWKLGRTHFTDPTGLDVTDVSTAGNVARLARHVFTAYPDYFSEATDHPSYTFRLRNSGKLISVDSTNKFNGHGLYKALAFKTGYYPGSAERTLAIEIEEISTGHQIIIVLLGNPEYDTINKEAEELAAWTFKNWDFHNY